MSNVSGRWRHRAMHNVVMSAPRPDFSTLRFAPALPCESGALSLDHDRVQVQVQVQVPAMLEVRREEGLDLLDWLGLGRPDFGAIPARELAPRCRRRLWDVERNAHASLRARTSDLLAVAEQAGEGLVLFG